MSTEAPATRTIQCGCHCGKVKFAFKAAPDAKDGVFHATRCNCTFCNKLATTNLHMQAPGENFILHSPSSKDQIASYRSGDVPIDRFFCSTCGVHCWMEGAYPHEDKMIPVFAPNLRAVNQPQDGIDLSEVKIQYYNMLANDFTSGLADAPYKGGLL